MTESTLDPTLVEAFRQTEYRVGGDQPFILAIDEQSPALAAAHERHGVLCSAYITACNPLSVRMDGAGNAQRHADLGRELAERSLASVEGVGQHPSDDWPGEASYLVFGLSLDAAKALGTRLQQNAVVWSGEDARPLLILLR